MSKEHHLCTLIGLQHTSQEISYGRAAFVTLSMFVNFEAFT